jgi:hypothetical protein
MKKRVSNISPLRTSGVMAILYFFITLPLVLLMAIPMLFIPGQKSAFPVALLIALPFLYAFFGFLFTLYGTWVYNLVASFTGGFEYTSNESPEA